MSSRESDSANPQPRRPGPDAYPSGTPPYGVGVPGGFGADQFGPPGRSAAAAEVPADDDVPKTETTLTTRVRINIPGSRPIPPVVVRSPMKNEDSPAEPPAGPPGPRHRSDAGGSPVLGVMDQGARSAPPANLPPEWQDDPQAPAAAAPAPAPAASESESTGEWFRPRQKGRQEPATPVPAGAGAPAQAAGRPQAGAAPGARPAPAPAQESAPRPTGTPASPFAAARPAPGPQEPFAAGPGRAAPHGNDPYGNDPFAAPSFPEPAAEAPAAPADPFAPADRFGTAGGARRGPFPGPDQGGPRAAQGRPGQPPQGGQPRPGAEHEDTQIGGFEPFRDEPQAAGIPGPPAAERPGAARPADPFAPSDPFGPTDPFAPSDPFAPADPFATQRPGLLPSDARRPGPGRPNQAQQNGAQPFPGRPDTGLPQDPAGGARTADGQQPSGRFADVPFEPAKPFPGSPRAASPAGAQRPPAPGAARPQFDPEAGGAAEGAAEQPAPAAAKPAKARGKGGKLAVYAVGGLLFAGAAAYGTGLMMNQADIPEGTTVLGTDIGGDTRDQAVSALDGAIGATAQRPIQLKVGGQGVTLDPASAGLSFDSTATVDALTKHSYNPVVVIGSLAGGSKAVAPEVKVDRAKLKAALDGLASSSGQGLQEGFVRFTEAGQTEVVPGKAGQTLNASGAVDQVEQAFRNRAAGQPDGEISLDLTAAQPKVGQDALQAAADSLGKQVLAGQITVSAGARKWDFGKVTASKALTLAPDDTGKIVPKWDLDKLNAAVGSAFANTKIRKNGALVAITPQDVADAITATLDKTGKDRVFKFTV